MLRYARINGTAQELIRRTLAIALGVPAFIGALVLALWANDVRQDRDHTIAVEAPTPVFAGGDVGGIRTSRSELWNRVRWFQFAGSGTGRIALRSMYAWPMVE